MKKHILKALAIGMAMTLAISSFALMTGCGKEDADSDVQNQTEVENKEQNQDNEQNQKPEDDKVTVAEYYCGTIDGVDLANFCHFNEDGTYYVALYGGGFTDAGTWALKEGSCDYYTGIQKSEAGDIVDPASKKTASAYIELNSYNNSVVFANWLNVGQSEPATKLALDNGSIWVGTNMSTLIEFKADPEFNDADGIEGIFRVELQKLYAENSETKTLVLYHDMSYEDLTGAIMSSGTFTIGENGTYTLKDELTEETKTLTVNADGTAKLGETELNNKLLVDAEFTGNITFSAVQDAETLGVLKDNEMTATLTCDAKAGTFTLSAIADVYGVMQVPVTIASGTYTETPDPAFGGMIPAYTFTAGDGVEITATASVSETFVVTYTATVTLTDAPISVDMQGTAIPGTATGSGTLTYVVELAL